MTLADKLKVIAGIGIVGLATLTTVYSYYWPDTIETTINGTDVKRYKDKDKFLVFTDAGVFENTDAYYRLKWNSADVQNKAKKFTGKRAKIKKYGWRFASLSMFENITAIDPV